MSEEGDRKLSIEEMRALRVQMERDSKAMLTPRDKRLVTAWTESVSLLHPQVGAEGSEFLLTKALLDMTCGDPRREATALRIIEKLLGLSSTGRAMEVAGPRGVKTGNIYRLEVKQA